MRIDNRSPSRLRFAAALAIGLLAAPAIGLVSTVATADEAGESAVQSTLYFGLKSTDGRGVSEQQWATFIAEVVTPRFPHGLTVVNAYGQGTNPGSDAVLAETTKVLIIVHPRDAVDDAKIDEIKSKYSQEFGGIGVFHTESDVRIVR